MGIKLLQKKIAAINKALLLHYGQPARNAEFPKPIDMLIATILSQNTNDRNSHRAWIKLKTKYKSWNKITNVSLEQLQNEIRIAGLSKQKAMAIKGAIDKLTKEKNSSKLNAMSEMTDFEVISYLTSFEGVGLKTASCVLLFSLNRNICPVDTHIHRTTNRIGLVQTSSADKTFWELNNNLPPFDAHSFHTNLIKLGREFCRPVNPACNECPLKKLCGYKNKNLLRKKHIGNSFMLLDNI